MTSSIILKKSSVTAKVPVAGDLAYGEVALNYADGKLYYKKIDNTIDSFTAGGSSVNSVTLDTAQTITGTKTLRSSLLYESPDQSNTISSNMLNGGTLSFEGDTGQLFSITDSMTGTIFSVNDVSGIPSIEVVDTGLVKLAEYSGNVVLGSATDNGVDKLQVTGSAEITGQTSLGGAAGSESFRAVVVAGQNCYVEARGGVYGTSSPALISRPTGAGAGFNIANGNQGNLNFYTNDVTSASLQASVAHTASAVNYLQVTGSAVGGNPTISVQGSEATRGLSIFTKGASNVNFLNNNGSNYTFIINGNAGNVVNFLQATAAVASSGPSLSAQGSDTNIDLALTTKGTGAVKVYTGTGEMVRVADSSGTGFVQLSGGTNPYVVAQGSTNANLSLGSNGTGTVFLRTNGGGTTQAAVAHTASAVNYVQVTGASTGNRVRIDAAGSDGNVGINYSTKGSDKHNFLTSGVIQFSVANTTSAVNRIDVTGAVAGSAPRFEAVGSDTNIDLALTPKGTGTVVVNSAIQIDSNLLIGTATATTTATTSDQIVMVVDATVYRAVKFLISVEDSTNSKYHTCEILAIHNGTTANSTEYGSINIGGICATFNVDYSSGSIRLLATPTSANSTVFTVSAQSLK